MKFPISNFKSGFASPARPVGRAWRRLALLGVKACSPLSAFRTSGISIVNRLAFSLAEVLVAVSLLSLIVMVLMQVFSSTQRAFRASLTQAGMLEGGRATMEMMARDLRALAPSGGTNNGAVNFWVVDNTSYSAPLVQSLPATTQLRSNLLQQVFILNRYNNRWWGVAYAIGTNNQSANLCTSLYRLQFPTIPTNDPSTLFMNPVVTNFFANPANGNHLLDGVVHLTVRAYDTNGTWLTINYPSVMTNSLKQSTFFPTPLQGGETGMVMYSNNLPAAVELQLGVMEDQVLAKARSQGLPYLANQSGAVHLFRQRVSIPNVDLTAY